MKTKALLMPSIARWSLVAGMTAIAFTTLVIFARADVAPTVTTAIKNTSNVTTTSASIGSNVYAYATVASSSATTSPAGTVTFNRYGNTSCSGVPTTQAAVALINGFASSSLASVPATGLSYKVHYNGQTGVYSEADGACQSVVATASSTGLTTTLSTTSVAAGSTVNETATLSGTTANASGTVAYAVYTNSSCSNSFAGAGVRTVTNAIVPASDSILFNNAGTYYWRAVYSGDINNAPATSSCLALQVIATSTSATTTPGSISGKVYNDLDGDEKLDAGEPGIQGFMVKLHARALWSEREKRGSFATTTTDANGNYAFTNLPYGVYRVELINKSGWHQDTRDYRRLQIKADSTSVTNINFANSSSTKNGNDDDDDDHGNKGGKGKHKGWFNVHGWGWWSKK